MSQDSADSWLLAAFADPARELWGLIGGGAERRAAVRRLGPPAAEPADEAASGAWRPAPELALSPAGGSADAVSATAGADDVLRLLRVSGTHRGGGEPLALEAPAVVYVGPTVAKLDSIRILVAWFPDDRSVAISAVRPRGGHADKDVVSVLVTGAGVVPDDPVAPGEPEPLQVFDPRLSTTYNGHGVPIRAGLELWLGPDEDSDQRPLRVSSESTGDRLAGEVGNLSLEAYGQRCHSRGQNGIGIYALLRPY
jgi:hypothetical protein